MTTKEYLSQISRLNTTIKNKLSEISQIRELSYSISAISSEEKVKTTLTYDKIGSTYAKIDALQHQLNQIIYEYVDRKNEIIAQIDNMENEIFYDILFSRYVEQKTFERIAQDMNYSFRQITRLHEKALKEFEKKYGATYLEK